MMVPVAHALSLCCTNERSRQVILTWLSHSTSLLAPGAGTDAVDNDTGVQACRR